jgi:hypothetical protein
MESQIKENVETQCEKSTGTTAPLVTDEGSLPSFKSKNKDKMVPGAILETVKIAAVVERGLEVLVKVLEEEGGGGLMGVCEMKPVEVRGEMQGAVRGIKRVLMIKAKVE